MASYRIKWRGINHPVQKWAKDRNVKSGWYPAPCPVMDKPNGTKGLPVPYDTAKLKALLLLNGNNYTPFNVARRLGGFLFNYTLNKDFFSLADRLLHLAGLKKLYIPYPLLSAQKARAEKIYCDGNSVTVAKIVGAWAELAPGTGYLTQVAIGTGQRMDSSVRWRVPGGWIAKSLLEKV